MTYATRTDLEQRYSADEVSQREQALDAGAVTRALEDADALINGYLAGRYALPLATVPTALVRVAAAIARYNLLGEAATDRAREDNKDAIAWLKDVQAGRVLLDGVPTPAGTAPGATVTVTSAPSVFKRAGRP